MLLERDVEFMFEFFTKSFVKYVLLPEHQWRDSSLLFPKGMYQCCHQGMSTDNRCTTGSSCTTRRYLDYVASANITGHATGAREKRLQSSSGSTEELSVNVKNEFDSILFLVE